MRQSFFALRFRQLLLPSVIAIIFACKPSKMIYEGYDVMIEIVSADTANDSLVLARNGMEVENSKNDSIGVYRKKNVSWFIGRAQNVKDFYIIMNKVQGSEDIFTSNKPPSKPTKAGGAKVKDKKRGKYIYSIIWTDTLGGSHTFDPKISIMPT